MKPRVSPSLLRSDDRPEAGTDKGFMRPGAGL